MMKKIHILSTFFLSFFLMLSINAKEYKKMSLDDFYKTGTFRAESVRGLRSMNDGEHYTTQERGGAIVKWAYKTGALVDTVFSLKQVNSNIAYLADYEFSADEKFLLISTNVTPIYRRSYTADYFIYNIEKAELSSLSENGAQQFATFSPDASKVAFVRENNLFIKNLKTNVEQQITSDGEFNKIINGACDWVYEEEFGFAKAFQWSPDGTKIAFYKFQEERVKMFNMNMFNRKLYPDNYAYKYPKAGEENSIVSIHVYDLSTQKISTMDVGKETDQYIARIKWSKNPTILSLIRLNRLQNKVDILLADATTGSSKVIYTETNKYYIAEVDDTYLNFLEDEKHFLISSEKDGWRHLYLFDINGNEIQQLTQGEFDVTDFIGLDEKKGLVYFTAAKSTPMNREVYSVNLKGKKMKLLTPDLGTNHAVFSKGFKYFINYHSTLNTPAYITLNDSKGEKIRVLKDNANLINLLKEYQPLRREFLTITTSEGVKLNAWILKPFNFDETKEYPVMMTQYSGPNSQSVTNSWSWGWNQYLAQEGYIVVCVDPRGTGARGEAFRKMTYGELGKYETIDQIEAAKFLGNLPFVDKNRIGIWGWSYGGFMSTSCLFKGNDVFSLAIAVAPVTNWRYYDSVYTERFMGLPQQNASGYDDNSPINHVDKFVKGKYLLVHGTGDDNVHVQNAWELVEKLVQANKQFEMQFYPDKNHGIYGGNTSYHLYNRMSTFIFENL